MSKKIVIIGGGFAGLNALKSIFRHFKRQVLKGTFELILVNDKNYFLFIPLLHEVVSSSVEREDIVHPWREICADYRAHFIKAKVIEVNFLHQKIRLDTHETISYDYLVMTLGAKPDLDKIKGADLYSLPLYSLSDAKVIRAKIINNLERASQLTDSRQRQKYLKILIVGGGPSGIELATEIRSFFDDITDLYPAIDFNNEVEICLFEAGSSLMANFGRFFSRKAYDHLKKNQIKVFTNALVKKIAGDHIVLEDGRIIVGSIILWNAGIKSALINFVPSIDLNANRIKVTPFLNLKRWPNVFAAGDMVCLADQHGQAFCLPQTAQVATQMGNFIGYNLKNLVFKKSLKEFHYRHKGFIVSLGRGQAVADVFGIEFAGILAWFLYRALYLANLPGLVNKIRIGFDWLIDFFFKRESTEDK